MPFRSCESVESNRFSTARYSKGDERNTEMNVPRKTDKQESHPRLGKKSRNTYASNVQSFWIIHGPTARSLTELADVEALPGWCTTVNAKPREEKGAPLLEEMATHTDLSSQQVLLQ